MKWCSVDENGLITMCGACPDTTTPEAFEHIIGRKIFNIPEDVSIGTHYVYADSFIPYPIQPSTSHVWDWHTRSWCISITLAEREIKTKRDTLLSQSDWTQLPDVPLDTKSAWATYRQALRDITDQTEYPLNVIWPDPPK